MATSVKLSKEFLIYYNDQAIARATDFDFEVNKQTVDITTLSSVGWRELMVDTKEWRVNFNALVTRNNPAATVYAAGTTYAAGALVTIAENDYVYISQDDDNVGNDPYTDDGTYWEKYVSDYDGLLQEIKENNASVEIILRSNTLNDSFEAGNGFITSLKMSGSVGDKVTYSGTVEGTADLETFTITE
jgi:predicted secreted protein